MLKPKGTGTSEGILEIHFHEEKHMERGGCYPPLPLCNPLSSKPTCP